MKMETFTFYPPRVQSMQMPYQELAPGDASCQHQLAEETGFDRISVLD
jgi:hypothetical protein